ncbi:hypothetical protein BpHYR1_018974, partial [Brachionus plicatilis]
MSYNYEETTISNALTKSGASFNAASSGGVYAVGSVLDANAFSTSSRAGDATSRIASDLLLGAANGSSASYGSSAGSALVASSGSAAYGSGAGASLAYGSGTSVAYGSGASLAYGSGAAGGSSVYLSEIEQAILRSSDPIS